MRMEAGADSYRGDCVPDASGRVGALTGVAARARGPRRGRILVMDDDRNVRDIMRRQLIILGYDVAESGDGRAAIDAFRQARDAGAPFHAVILDLVVPNGLGGEAVLSELVKLDPGVKALICSGSLSRSVAEYRERGFLGVLGKPYALEELRCAVAAAFPPAIDP